MRIYSIYREGDNRDRYGRIGFHEWKIKGHEWSMNVYIEEDDM